MVNLHPITVHFTIALFSTAVLFDILGWLLMKESLKVAAWWNLLFAVPSAIISVLSGRSEAANAPHNETIHEMITIHETMGYIVLFIIISLFIWRTISSGRYFRKLEVLYAAAGIIGFGAMTTGAYFGGELVFSHGLGVKPVIKLMAEQPHEHSHESTSQSHDDESLSQESSPQHGEVEETADHDHNAHSH